MPDEHRFRNQRRDSRDLGAMEQRVYDVEEDVRATRKELNEKIDRLSDGTAKQINALANSTQSQIEGVRADVSSKFDKIFDKLDQQQKTVVEKAGTPWFAIISSGLGIMTACVTIGGVVGHMAIQPLSDGIMQIGRVIERQADAADARFDRVLDAVEKLRDTRVQPEAYAEYQKRIDGALSQQESDRIREATRIEGEVKTMRADLVSRSEHMTHWENTEMAQRRLSDRIEAVQKEISGAYSIGDQLKNLQTQIEQLRERQGVGSAPRS